MIFKRVRQLLLSGALIASLSHVTVASAGESVDTSKMSIVLAEAMNETTDNTTDSSSNTDDLYEEAESLLEGFSEEELSNLTSILESKDTLELEEEVLLEASTDSIEKIAKSALDDYYENTSTGMKDYAQEIINEMTTNERQALIDELENKVNLNQEERLLLDTAYKTTKEGRFMGVAGLALISLAFGFYLVGMISM